MVVDMQNGFVERELPVPGAREIVPLVNELIGKFPLVVATQDWHPADHLSFASQHPGKRPFETGELAGKSHTLWPDHCVMGTWGADFVSDLETHRFAAIFRKGMHREVDSYSGFMDDVEGYRTGLDGFLREHGVGEIHLCGLALDHCVKATALHGRRFGFTVSVHLPATRPVTREGGSGAIREMKASGISVIA